MSPPGARGCSGWDRDEPVAREEPPIRLGTRGAQELPHAEATQLSVGGTGWQRLSGVFAGPP